MAQEITLPSGLRVHYYCHDGDRQVTNAELDAAQAIADAASKHFRVFNASIKHEGAFAKNRVFFSVEVNENMLPGTHDANRVVNRHVHRWMSEKYAGNFLWEFSCLGCNKRATAPEGQFPSVVDEHSGVQGAPQ